MRTQRIPTRSSQASRLFLGQAGVVLGAMLVVAPLGVRAETPPATEKTEKTEKVVAPPAEKPAAEEPVKEKKKKDEVVKTGVIASSSRIADYGAIDVQTSGSSPGDEVSALSGSISRTGRSECVARIVNGGEREYSVSFSVEGTNDRGLKVLNKYFSGSVKPKSTLERQVLGCAEGLNLGVNLKSARPIGK